MLSKMFIIGFIGRDAETKTLENGSIVTSFPLASTATWKNKQGEKQERTTWYNCTIWNNDKIGQFLTKGKAISVESKTQSAGAYINKEGKPVGTIEVIVESFTFLPSGAAATTQPPAVEQEQGTKQDLINDNLPF